MTLKHSSHARHELWYHVVWATKYRKHVFLNPYIRDTTSELLRDIARHYDMEIDTIKVLSDHVHCALRTPPRIAPAHAVQILKSVSTRMLFERFPGLRNEYWGGEIWIGGYFIRTIGTGITKQQIDRYIEEQSEEY